MGNIYYYGNIVNHKLHSMNTTAKEPTEAIQLPTLVRRIKALTIDGLLILLIFTITSLTIGSLGGVVTAIKVGVLVFCFLIYEPLLLSLKGATLGHMMMGLSVKKYKNTAQNLSFFSALLRLIVKALLGWLSLIYISFNKDKRAIHDMASGSIVLVK